MSWVDRYLQPPPRDLPLVVERVPVEGVSCPACGDADVRRYPVATQHGARIATKCQSCLHVLELERPGPDDWWPAFRAVTYDWEVSPAERAAREMMGKEA